MPFRVVPDRGTKKGRAPFPVHGLISGSQFKSGVMKMQSQDDTTKPSPQAMVIKKLEDIGFQICPDSGSPFSDGCHLTFNPDGDDGFELWISLPKKRGGGCVIVELTSDPDAYAI
jgi:hypothetical protein